MSRADEILQRAKPFLLRSLPIEAGYEPPVPLVVPPSHPLAKEPGVVVSQPLPEKMP